MLRVGNSNRSALNSLSIFDYILFHLIIGMPEGDYVFVKDLIDVLKRKHEANSYKSMVLKYIPYIIQQ